MNVSNRQHLPSRQFTLRPKLEIGQTLLIRVMRMPNVFTPDAHAFYGDAVGFTGRLLHANLQNRGVDSLSRYPKLNF